MKKFAYFGLYPKCLNLEGFTPLVGMMFVTVGRYIALARARLVKKRRREKNVCHPSFGKASEHMLVSCSTFERGGWK